jgi:hypothetical protein
MGGRHDARVALALLALAALGESRVARFYVRPDRCRAAAPRRAPKLRPGSSARA